jgi:YbgC/YbaW family acyl-CoA thioester hydrolase
MFETEFPVEWGDCDAAGIVYYPRYFDWFDRTFQRLLKAKGMNQRTLAEEFGIIGTALVDVGATFRGPVTFAEEITIMAETPVWEDKRFRLAYRVIKDDHVVAEGHEVRAWVGRDESGRLRGLPIPSAFRERLT